MTLLGVLIDFARTGRLGPLHCGMLLTEAGALLGKGSPHPAFRMIPNADGYPYTWGDLRLYITGGRVSGISIRSEPSRSGVDLPDFVLPDSERHSPVITLGVFTDALDAAGLHYSVDSKTIPEQRFLQIEPHDTQASFSQRYDPDGGQVGLLAVNRSAPMKASAPGPALPNPVLYPDRLLTRSAGTPIRPHGGMPELQ